MVYELESLCNRVDNKSSPRVENCIITRGMVGEEDLFEKKNSYVMESH